MELKLYDDYEDKEAGWDALTWDKKEAERSINDAEAQREHDLLMRQRKEDNLRIKVATDEF